MSLTPEQIATVKATVPALEVHGVAITTLFYNNLLKAHPELNNIFNHANQVHLEQPKALAAAVYAYARNIENLEALLPTVRLIAGKHTSLHVQPEHYPIVGKHLLEAIQEVLGEAATPEIISAWGAAYGVLANVFIETEKSMYAANGNWTDFEEFTISKIAKESDEISSFYLQPVKNQLLPLPKFLPGQVCS
jgi:nitric oxide dioxygenase